MTPAAKCTLVYSRPGSAEDAARAREELLAAADRSGWRVVDQRRHAIDALRAVVMHWPVADGAVLTARELVELARADASWRRLLVAWCPPRGKHDLPSPRSVGCKLHRARNVEIAGYALDMATRERGGRAWVRRSA